jgi:subtilisin-like proprotein convertase family protein
VPELAFRYSEGDWTLHVVDHANQDLGAINSWSLEIKRWSAITYILSDRHRMGPASPAAIARRSA